MIQGEIVLITFPFTDLKSIKVRPAIVISKEDFNKHNEDAIFIMITSNIKNIRQDDVLIKQDEPDFPSTGLKKESVIRTHKIYCLSKSLAQRKLGKVSKSILAKTLKQLNNLIF